MTRRLLVAGTALAAACAAGARGTVPAPTTPAPDPYATTPATTPPTPRTDAVRYGPAAARYLVRRQLHIQQALGDQPQVQTVGARIFVATAITGPADSVGYPAMFTVDSIVADSGTPPPIVDNVSKVRKLVFAGRVAVRGEFVNVIASDSAVAQSVIQLLGNFRDFLPRLPVDGAKPGAVWTDTVETHPQRASRRNADISRGGRGEERRAAVRALRCRDGERRELSGL
ncbi:MAG: hypothetical protein DMD46_03535 [Gemmatimonadetes bacterium]|nr:MAG: hypothetical protein DMD46_03535 [Gemmatimonadota bacterium]